MVVLIVESADSALMPASVAVKWPMVRDCQQNRGQDGGNSQPRSNSQDAAAVEPPKRNRFYDLKGK